ncbi:hypothetical protein TCAL_09465 [Tigriopus californicus]|uniref:Ig-like domain-containing protein n=1 Tax=Tigriopus californicus TaxID=6832 RepID=A0A553PM51_TIGCA|nr:uncharacterized protein LOC131890950 [Tigriopus californicus]TRY78755.1 hypothetical protein TCAL_09465 [Tigriopus californicus]
MKPRSTISTTNMVHVALSPSIVIFCLLVIDSSFALQMRSVDIPRFPTSSSTIRLVCNYDLGPDRLYSVKWYKDGSEFYRYVPKDTPPSQYFNVPSVLVDQDQSNDREVVLREISLLSSGIYTCEASSEAPRFKTISGQGHMKVIDLPDSKPILSGGSPKGYRVSEWMDVNCTSPNSRPPAQLKWYINNEMVDPRYIIQLPPFKSHAGLYTSTLRLRFQLKRHHFIQGHVTVKCTSTIYTEYFESSHLHVPGLGLGEKALESRTNGSPRLNSSQFPFLLISCLLFCLLTFPPQEEFGPATCSTPPVSRGSPHPTRTISTSSTFLTSWNTIGTSRS